MQIDPTIVLCTYLYLPLALNPVYMLPFTYFLVNHRAPRQNYFRYIISKQFPMLTLLPTLSSLLRYSDPTSTVIL